VNQIDLQDLRFGEGAHLLLKHALAGIAVGEEIVVHGQAPDLEVHLEAWGSIRRT
jgi:hypothetical protein